MNLPTRSITLTYWAIAALLVALATTAAVAYAPSGSSTGGVQKIFYVHLPVAINTFLACGIVFLSSVGYIWQRKPSWDLLAAASAQVAVLYCSILLITGILWAKDAWGCWWIWSPRLTFSLMLWILFVVYLVLRLSIRDPARRGVACAVYGLVAFLDVPLVYISVKLLPDVHPSNVQLTPAMQATLLLWFFPVTMICAGLVFSRFRWLHLAPEPKLRDEGSPQPQS